MQYYVSERSQTQKATGMYICIHIYAYMCIYDYKVCFHLFNSLENDKKRERKQVNGYGKNFYKEIFYVLTVVVIT
jgi:hypothetical protein